jgi:hypothetical protein
LVAVVAVQVGLLELMVTVTSNGPVVVAVVALVVVSQQL